MSKYNRNKVIAGPTTGTPGSPGDATQATPPPDQFVSFWQRLGRRLAPHVPKLGLLVALILVGALGTWVVGLLSSTRKEAASEELAQAMRILQGELLADKDTPSALEDVPRFKTAKERGDAALAALDKLDKDHGGSDAAVQGILARAGILFDQERYDEADAAYRQFLAKKPKDSALLALAREGLGMCAEARSKLDPALLVYKEQADAKDQADSFYRDRILLDQARVYIKMGDKKKAVEIYKDVLAKSPQSPLRDDIANRLTALED